MKLAAALRNSLFLTLAGLGAILAQETPMLQGKERLQRIQKLPQTLTRLQSQVPLAWTVGRMAGFASAKGSKGARASDGVMVQGPNSETDTYTVLVDTDLTEIHAIRIEALTEPSLGGGGPGRAPNGNFVISEVTVSARPKSGGTASPVQFSRAEADFEQAGFGAAHAIDGNRATGWAIQGTGKWNVNRALTLTLASTVKHAGGGRWTITVDQNFGSNHTLGRFRILFGSPRTASKPIELTNVPIPLSGLKQQAIDKTPLKLPILATGNWDFETGLQGWTVGAESGDNRAFLSQPTYGDNVYALRLKEANTKVIGFDPAIATLIGGNYWDTPVYTGKMGDWWIGSSENRPNRNLPSGGRGSEWHRGNLVSPDFRIDKPVLSCLVSGGNSADLRVELQLKQADGAYSTLASVTGSGNDVMVRIKWVVPASANGGLARYKIVDNSVTGHINADDFRSGERLPADPAPVWGFVDTHAHPMVHLAFGSIDPNSSIIWGQPGGRLEDANPLVELRACDGMLHNNMGGQSTQFIDHVLRLIGNFVGNFHRHDPGGFETGFAGWPASGGVAGLIHQQMYVQWIKRAYDGGQRIMVAAALNNQLLQRIIRNGFDAQYQSTSPYTVPNATLDFEACKMQTIMMKGFAAQNSAWMEVVTTPAQARDAIRRNKLAIVLAVETDWLNSIDQVQELYNLGVRHITPVHLMDNIFGSAAVYNNMFNSLNAFYHGNIFEVDNGAPHNVNFLPERVIPYPKWWANLITAPGFPTGNDLFSRGYTVDASYDAGKFPPFSALKHTGFINKNGLKNYTKVIGGGDQPDPIAAYKRMMRLGMLIDVAHMSQKSVNDLFDLVDPNRSDGEEDYPLHSSHGGIRERSDHRSERELTTAQCRRILAMGGTIGLGMGAAQVATAGNMVANDSQGTSKSFAQLVQHGNTLMDAGTPARGLTLGSDFNGLNGMMGPRFGPKAPSGSSAQQNGIRYLNVVTPPGMIVHPTNPMMRPSTIMSAKGTRTFNYNVEGLAHCGLVPDMFQDLRNTGLAPEQIGTLFRGAEDFIRMWEKCERLKTSIP